MNLLQKLKNYKTRKQLLERIESLQFELNHLYAVQRFTGVEEIHDINKLSATVLISRECSVEERDIIAKQYICKDLAKLLEPYLDYECYCLADSPDREMKCTGSIRIIKPKKRRA